MDGWMGGGVVGVVGVLEHKQLHTERVQVEWIGSELFRFLFRTMYRYGLWHLCHPKIKTHVAPEPEKKINHYGRV